MTTLLISVSNNNVFRNLFFFPGSVFNQLADLLERNFELKIVFVLPPVRENDFGKFIKERIPPESRQRCTLEYVSIDESPGFARKLFRFFYSYFIYTGTTRMLATMGMRPDEPPGGGNWYLNPFKYLIARSAGRSFWMRERLIPFIYSRLNQETGLAKLLVRYRPQAVLMPHLFGEYDLRVLSEAKRLHLLTVGMISNWDHFDKYYLPLRPDILLAQSEQILEFAIRYQSYRAEQIRLVGYPQIDFVLSASEKMPRETLLDKLGFPANSRYILYISGSAYCPDEPDIIAELLLWIDRGLLGPDVYLVIRPYLAGRGADRAFDAAKYERFSHHPRVRFYQSSFWDNLEDGELFFSIMRHSGAVIGIYTTALLEAAALGRPLLITMFDGHARRPFGRSVRRFALREHFKQVLESGAVRMVNNFSELLSALKEYLQNPDLDSEKRESLCKKVLYRIDGGNSRRIVNELSVILRLSS